MVSERLLKYVKIDTESDPHSDSFPSTKKQFDLAYILEEELKELGLTEVKVDKYGYVTATLESNTKKNIPVLGLLSHMDTAPAFTGKNVNPQIVKNYDGKDVVLNKEENIVMKVEDFPELEKAKGLDLVVTDGKTLLGADDKAGIAIIMDTLEHLTSHPEIPHGKIRVAFTPDEEVGRGVDYFNVEEFGADFAFTLDGSRLGEIQYECFFAVGAKIKIQGVSVHPGSAKNKMINSISLAMELDGMLPKAQRPEYTENYEGFFHLDEIKGNVDSTEMEYILRDFAEENILKMQKTLTDAVSFLNEKYGKRIVLEMEESYRNMREKIEPHMDWVDLAIESMEELGIEPIVEPIRGGTDGSRLSWMGLPTPNLFTGGMNFHGKFEYIPVQHMEMAKETLLVLFKKLVERA
ncbi:peptidase T [Peptoniphilus sp. KCTC 25270]|uniref:peptidase T n=1 Tax=Peptoniphilus sp. KCTC 25270 TaxID=2897414 RepID=UPI001E5A2022|nr:peptidase T [Peptoniphilus sp. KCTC 25270]MCD1146563.1 peptidase T [Peptoniphilus sp. KCTC 25270]